MLHPALSEPHRCRLCGKDVPIRSGHFIQDVMDHLEVCTPDRTAADREFEEVVQAYIEESRKRIERLRRTA